MTEYFGAVRPDGTEVLSHHPVDSRERDSRSER